MTSVIPQDIVFEIHQVVDRQKPGQVVSWLLSILGSSIYSRLLPYFSRYVSVACVFVNKSCQEDGCDFFEWYDEDEVTGGQRGALLKHLTKLDRKD